MSPRAPIEDQWLLTRSGIGDPLIGLKWYVRLGQYMARPTKQIKCWKVSLREFDQDWCSVYHATGASPLTPFEWYPFSLSDFVIWKPFTSPADAHPVWVKDRTDGTKHNEAFRIRASWITSKWTVSHSPVCVSKRCRFVTHLNKDIREQVLVRNLCYQTSKVLFRNKLVYRFKTVLISERTKRVQSRHKPFRTT